MTFRKIKKEKQAEARIENQTQSGLKIWVEIERWASELHLGSDTKAVVTFS